jgi:hypothetical protein
MGKKAMKRYHFIIDTAYDWSDTSSAELAFENAFIREEEYPDGTWVKWEDVAKLEESNAQLLDALKKTQAWMSKQPQLQSYNYEDCGTLNERDEYYIAEGIYNNNERLIRQY